MRFAIAILLVALAGVSAFGQTPPTLRIETPSGPELPAQLFYGDVRVKPVRIRPGTNQVITIDDNDYFVQDQYVKFLFRFPDQGGFNFWWDGIKVCGTDENCIRGKRVDTSAAFFLSIEFQESGYLVERAYKVAYGDAIGKSTCCEAGLPQHDLPVPIVTRSEFVPDIKAVNLNVVVGTPGWPDRLNANKAAYFLAFVQRSRFTTAYPPSMTPTQFVQALNNNSGGALDAPEQAEVIALFGAGATDTSNVSARAQVVRRVAEDPTLYASEFNRAWVLMQYMGYLLRDPNTGPDSDHTGYEFWLRKLNEHNGDFRSAEMVRAFIESIEYRHVVH
jgi:hypothetical protein